jgi:transcriptional regulator with XRE-family HTH domain
MPRRSFHRALGERVRNFRESRGYSQEQLAQAVGIESATMSRYETAKAAFPLDVLVRIAAELDVAMPSFVDVGGQRPPPADSTDEVLAVWRQLTPQRKKLALRILSELRRP